jgi:O-antigen/teichoic acid export membrane protein
MNSKESQTDFSSSPAQLSLKERMKFLMKDSALYGTAMATSRLFSLLTFPLLTRYFSTENYGLIDAFMVLTSLLTTLVIFGQDLIIYMPRLFYAA